MWAVWLPHQRYDAVILCHLLHNTCHICTDKWVFKLCVNTCGKHFYTLTENNQASCYDLSVESDSDALFHSDSFPMYCLTAVMVFLCAQRQIHGWFYLSFGGWCVVGGRNDSVYNNCLSRGFDPMGARPQLEAPPLSPHLHLWGQPTTTGQLFSFFFALPCLWVSGGPLFPVQAQCRLWAPEQYCAQRAGKKLHVATFTSHYARKIPVTSISKQVWLYTSPLDEREKKTFKVHVPLPSQTNMVVPERDYLTINLLSLSSLLFRVCFVSECSDEQDKMK